MTLRFRLKISAAICAQNNFEENDAKRVLRGNDLYTSGKLGTGGFFSIVLGKAKPRFEHPAIKK
jgi:hypothetical protein